jgi:hypothetical protein
MVNIQLTLKDAMHDSATSKERQYTAVIVPAQFNGEQRLPTVDGNTNLEDTAATPRFA